MMIVPRPARAPEDDEGSRALLALMGLPTCYGCAAGSNNWVIAGSHTASGKPLLSNDMHLGLTEPISGTWPTSVRRDFTQPE